MILELTDFVAARVVSDLQGVDRDAPDAGLAQGVKPGDVRAFVVNMLEHCCQFGIVVVLKLYIGLGLDDHGQGSGQDQAPAQQLHHMEVVE